MAFHQVKWSPVEIEYLLEHKTDPIMQLTIALSKSRNAIKNKLNELLHTDDSKAKTKTKQQGLRSRIGKRSDLNNMFFRSSWESNLARFLLQHPDVQSFQYEPTDFTFWQFGIKKGTVSYTPDFKIFYKDGHYEWLEVKGGLLKSADKTKIRRFQKYYPDEFAKLVAVTPGIKSKTYQFFTDMSIPVKWIYNDLNKKYKAIIPHWE